MELIFSYIPLIWSKSRDTVFKDKKIGFCLKEEEYFWCSGAKRYHNDNSQPQEHSKYFKCISSMKTGLRVFLETQLWSTSSTLNIWSLKMQWKYIVNGLGNSKDGKAGQHQGKAFIWCHLFWLSQFPWLCCLQKREVQLWLNREIHLEPAVQTSITCVGSTSVPVLSHVGLELQLL